jgi:hypothetical protein
VKLLPGELASVPDLQVLNGANLAAVRSTNGEWEVLQFALAEEIAPSVWRLSRLLRGQYGTRPAMLAGAEAGAHFVLLDGAVAQAGLRAHEIGLALNWRVGPFGYDFSGPAFSAETTSGGLRARRRLSPVHLAARRQADGSLTPRPVLIGVSDWSNSEILIGAEEGEQVAVIGGAQLQARQQDMARQMRVRMGTRGPF